MGVALDTDVDVEATAFKYAPVVPSGLGVVVDTIIGAFGAVAPPRA
jgi:hypothetical protein